MTKEEIDEAIENLSHIEKSQTELLEKTLKEYFEQNKIQQMMLSEFQNVRSKNDSLISEKLQLKSELNRLQSDFEQKENDFVMLKRNSEDLEQIRDKFTEIDISPLYEKLSDKVKDSLNIFVTSEPISLLSAGIQKDNLVLLYNSLFSRIKQDKLEDYDELVEIVRRLFEIYNLGQKEPYILIDPAIGSAYNEEEHLIKGSELRGTISKVWLFGYKTIQGKVLKQAFVSIG